MCGIIGVIGTPQAAQEVYHGLLLLQHRGQDAAGILSYDQTSSQFHLHKDKGLVGAVFDERSLNSLQGRAAIGHTRYATVADKTAAAQRDLQPMVVNFPHGIGLVHNGNIVNVGELTEHLREQCSRIMLTKNDAEVLLNMVADTLFRVQGHTPLEQLSQAALRVFDDAQGGYAVAGVLGNGGLFAFRDPHGIRPLVMGSKRLPHKENAHAVAIASESHVLDFLGYGEHTEVAPGELVLIENNGTIHRSVLKNSAHHPCMFEWIYFATPESRVDGNSVYQARLRLGRNLGHKVRKLMMSDGFTPDVVVPVPETSRVAAIGLAETIGVPYREVLIKNRYIQRSFILQDQASRQRAVQLKLMPVADELTGKRVLLVDDSIVRGTTSRRLIEMVREAGAAQVYFASTCPPIRHSCFFGIDFPDREELIAAHLSEDEVARVLGADRVIYQDLAGLHESIGKGQLCEGCITGEYPFDISKAAQAFQKTRHASQGLGQ